MPFTGGLVGYFGYETIQFIENKIQVNKEDSLGVPDIFLFVCNEIIIFDNEENAVHIVLNKRTNQEDSYESAIKRIDDLEKIIKQKTAFKKL